MSNTHPFAWHRPRGDQEPEFRTSAPPDGHGWLPVPGSTVGVEVKVDEAMLQTVRDELNVKERVFFDIVAERLRQNEQWGGPDRDDKNSGGEWLGYVNYQKYRAQQETLADNELDVVDPEGYRARLVKIAALAVAAIESHDRKHGVSADESATDDFANFGKDELLDFLDGALPDSVSLREFSMNYWVGVNAGFDEPTDKHDDAIARAMGHTRTLTERFRRTVQAEVSVDFSDESISIKVGG